MPVRSNLTFDLGEDWCFDHTAYQADGLTPIDLTGAEQTLQISSHSGSLISPDQIQWSLTDAINGKSTFLISAASQIGIRPGVYTYTLRFTLAGGAVIDQNCGTWVVSPTAFSPGA